MKIAVNKCFGGFSLSEEVYNELGIKWGGSGHLGNEDLNIESDDYLAFRQDKRLINAIEKVGVENAGGSFADIKIVDVPDCVDWEIEDYKGLETVRECSRSW